MNQFFLMQFIPEGQGLVMQQILRKTSSTRIFCWNLRGALALALLVAVVAPATWAKCRDNTNRDAVQVIASLPFVGNPSDMTLREDSAGFYLDLQFSDSRVLRTMDVTQPAELKKERTAAIPGQIGKHSLILDGKVNAVAQDSNQAGNEDVSLWEISQPGNPRLVQMFFGVERIIEDRRGYIYVLHAAGLSVLKDQQCASPENPEGTDYSIYG